MRYNTNLTAQFAQGASLINETLVLLPAYKENMTRRQFSKYVIENGLMPSCTERRITNVVEEVFFKRFVERNPSLPKWLAAIREKGLLLEEFRQILMVYCARDIAIYYNFIIEALNPCRGSGTEEFNKTEAGSYLERLQKEGKINWKETVHKKISSSLNTALKNFDQVSSKGKILECRPSDFTILYFIHELHFAGLSDVAIVNDTDWQLFNLSKEDVITRIMDLNIKGGYIAQHSGDLLVISWNHKTMEEFIDATL